MTFHSDFPAITLANSGDSITLTGSVTLSGITATDGGTFQQLRFGLFDRSGSPDTNGWLGYFQANSSGGATQSGVIRQRVSGNAALFISNTGTTVVANADTFPNSRSFATLADDMQLRMNRAMYLLSGSTTPIKEIAGQTGFEDAHYFSRAFKKKAGCSPDEWRRRYLAKAQDSFSE